MSSRAKLRLVSTPATDRAQQGRRVAAVTAQQFPRRQGTLRDAWGAFRAPRKAGHAASGTPSEGQPVSLADLAAVARPAAQGKGGAC